MRPEKGHLPTTFSWLVPPSYIPWTIKNCYPVLNGCLNNRQHQLGFQGIFTLLCDILRNFSGSPWTLEYLRWTQENICAIWPLYWVLFVLSDSLKIFEIAWSFNDIYWNINRCFTKSHKDSGHQKMFFLLSFKEFKSCQETTVNFQSENFIEIRLEFQRRNFDETLLKFRVCQKCYTISREI